jgi:hypothetical protein
LDLRGRKWWEDEDCIRRSFIEYYYSGDQIREDGHGMYQVWER